MFRTDMTADQWLKAHRDHLIHQLAEASQQASYWTRRRDDLAKQVSASTQAQDETQE